MTKNERKRLILFWFSFYHFKTNQIKIGLFLSFFISFESLFVVKVSFCGLIKEISQNICILCVRVKINKRSFGPVCAWIETDRQRQKNRQRQCVCVRACVRACVRVRVRVCV